MGSKLGLACADLAVCCQIHAPDRDGSRGDSVEPTGHPPLWGPARAHSGPLHRGMQPAE
jgi:hypothetical protein